jgi:hypothetical protein
MHREHYSWIKGAIPLVVSCSYVVLFIEPCFSMEHGSIKCVHQTAGSSKLFHLKSGSSKSVHQKSDSLKSVHWKSCSGDVHSPKNIFASGGRGRPMSRLPS